MKFLRKISCVVLFSVIILSVLGRSNYTLGLIRYLKEESRLHQVIFVTDDQFLANNESNANAQLIRNVSQNFPSLSMSLNKAREHLEKYFSLHLQLPRRTTLFIFILNGAEKKYVPELNATFSKLEFLSRNQSYPKCLINFFKSRKVRSYESMLKSLWHRDMLDISILENVVVNRSWQTEDVTTIHRINLFEKKYTKQNVKQRTKWFPNKLLDLHGHPLRFASTTNNVKGNEEIFISTQKFRDYIQQSMHCKTTLVYYSKIKYLLFLRDKKKFEMLVSPVIASIRNNAVTFVSMRILSFQTSRAVIENVRSKTQSVEVSEEFIYMIVATTIAIAAIRIAAALLKFNRSTWNTFSISQMIMGMSVANEPRKFTERLVLGSVILSCMIYSGYLFSVILDINFRETPQISTIEELVNSSLTPMTSSFKNSLMLESPQDFIKKLASNAVRTPGLIVSDYDCLQYLVNNRNVSCIIFNAETLINKIKLQYKEFSFKILQGDIGSNPYTFITRNRSPFIDRFNEIILRAFDHGLLQGLLFVKSPKMEKVSSLDIIEKEKLLLVLFYVLTIGYTLAAIAFVAEIFNNFICSKVKQFWENCLNFF